MRELLLDNSTVTIEKQGEIIITNLKATYVDITIAKQAVKYRLECTNNNPCLLLSNIRQVKNSTQEARNYLASAEGSERIICCAMLIDSTIGAMIGNFFVRINKPIVPVRIFVDETEAKAWLLNYKK
jgi:hypothetical protein